MMTWQQVSAMSGLVSASRATGHHNIAAESACCASVGVHRLPPQMTRQLVNADVAAQVNDLVNESQWVGQQFVLTGSGQFSPVQGCFWLSFLSSKETSPVQIFLSGFRPVQGVQG